MKNVIFACLPAIIAEYYFYGLGIITNIIYSIIFAIILEALCLKLRDKNYNFKTIKSYLLDCSAVLTAILFSLCLPADFNIYKILLGLFFAIVIAKHIYGGLGHNIFNPAMIGYIVLLVCWPQDFTYPLNGFDFIADDISQATPLDPIFSSINNELIKNSMVITHNFVNLTWLIGGLYLLFRKIIPLSLPLGYMIGIFATSILLLINNNDFNIQNSFNQLFIGSSMMGAFFIITDPVTAATTSKGRWLYSILAGVFCIIIRFYSGYPDGTAFSIIFMNTWVPLINKFTISKPANKI